MNVSLLPDPGLMGLVPSTVVALTMTTPPSGDELDGEVAVALVDELTVTLVAAVLPNFTVIPLAKPVPVRVTDVPPATEPVAGLTPVTVGGGSYVYRSELLIALVPW